MKKLNTTQQIPIDSLLRIYKKGYGYAILTVIDVHQRYIAGECSPDIMPFFSHGDQVDVYLWVEKQASFDFTVQVTGSITIGEPVLFISHTDAVKQNSERRCLKANVHLPVRFFTLDTGDLDRGMSTEKIVHHSGTIVELSDREAVIECEESIAEEPLIKIHLSFNNRDHEIIGHIDKRIQGEHTKKYEVTFTGTPSSLRNELLDYVISIYRE